jgi:uncharacterized membrane protein
VNVEGQRHGGRTAVVGTVVAIYTFFDSMLIGVPILVLAAWLNPLVVAVVALVVVTLLNYAACSWVDRQWDLWLSGSRFEQRLEKVRNSKRARSPVKWIERGSDAWFFLAAALLNAVEVVALARLIGGRPVDNHRILVASVGFAAFCAVIFSAIGFALGDVIRAL